MSRKPKSTNKPSPKRTVSSPAFYNMDCVEGCRRHIGDGEIDLIITDPPYGIDGDRLDKHYNRKEEFVVDGYVEVPRAEYFEFTRNWIREAERILRPGGSIYIVSGYTNLIHILNALAETSLEEVNHIIWKFNFGVYTRRKFISSHYHILFYEKPGRRERRTFNTFCRFGAQEKTDNNGSRNYVDREDVWIINREYKPGRAKNKNELPTKLLMKMIQYSSNEGDTVCDLFLGGFSTARVALGMNRAAVGFELNREGFEHHRKAAEAVEPGHLLKDLRVPEDATPEKQGQPWTEEEVRQLLERYEQHRDDGKLKKEVVALLMEEFGRGYWAIIKLLDKVAAESEGANTQDRLW